MSGTAHDLQVVSDWVARFAPLIRRGGRVADVACGQGRNARYLGRRGLDVVAIDRDRAALDTLRCLDGIEVLAADIESQPWPLQPGTFDAVVVTNYLWRPVFPHLIAALRAGGVLIYETFALGNERFGRPSNPDFLLRRNELLELCMPELQIVAFEQGEIARPKPAVVQRICAARSPGEQPRLDPDAVGAHAGDSAAGS